VEVRGLLAKYSANPAAIMKRTMKMIANEEIARLRYLPRGVLLNFAKLRPPESDFGQGTDVGGPRLIFGED
jgi:hypothetical protein